MSRKVITLYEDWFSSIKLLPIFSTRLQLWMIKKRKDLGIFGHKLKKAILR